MCKWQMIHAVKNTGAGGMVEQTSFNLQFVVLDSDTAS